MLGTYLTYNMYICSNYVTILVFRSVYGVRQDTIVPTCRKIFETFFLAVEFTSALLLLFLQIWIETITVALCNTSIAVPQRNLAISIYKYK